MGGVESLAFVLRCIVIIGRRRQGGRRRPNPSDGFLALATDYGRYDAEGLLAAARNGGLKPLLQELREIEAEDPQGRRFPRFKQSDDATAVLVQVRPD